MSKFYCMCQITGDIPRSGIDSSGFGPPDNQKFLAPNRFGQCLNEEEHRPVFLRQEMECIAINVTQRKVKNVLRGDPPPNRWTHKSDKKVHDEDVALLANSKLYHLSVSVYRCKHCGAMICRE